MFRDNLVGFDWPSSEAVTSTVQEILTKVGISVTTKAAQSLFRNLLNRDLLCGWYAEVFWQDGQCRVSFFKIEKKRLFGFRLYGDTWDRVTAGFHADFKGDRFVVSDHELTICHTGKLHDGTKRQGKICMTALGPDRRNFFHGVGYVLEDGNETFTFKFVRLDREQIERQIGKVCFEDLAKRRDLIGYVIKRHGEELGRTKRSKRSSR